jgi:cysteine desulfurase
VAGQPLLPVARQAWLAAAEQGWSDPARLHHAGRRAGLLLDAARSSIAASLGVRPDEVFLTSSGPTAAGVAVQGLMSRGRTGRAVVSSVESLAVTSPVERWAALVDAVPVDRTGRIDLEALASALTTPADLLCVQAANGEVGTHQPLADVAAAARAVGVPLLVHAVQVIGRGPVPADWDVLAASARDWGGPAGVGVLAVRSSVRWTPDENPDRGWVNGFPDIAGAAAAATALEYLAPHVTAEAERLFALTELIRSRLPALAPGVEVVGEPVDRLPHIVTFTCAGVTGETVVHELDRRGISVASGSACTSDTRMPSQVLAAMGLAADASVRVSLPFGCTEETVADFLRVVPEAIAAARSGA